MHRLTQLFFLSSVLMASSVAIALEPAAQGASAFLDHPAFCSQLIQGTESDADGMTKGYEDALSEAIKSANFGSENEAFAKVGEWCARKIADQKEEAYAKTIQQIEEAHGKPIPDLKTETELTSSPP